jgi:hypothetical protein
MKQKEHTRVLHFRETWLWTCPLAFKPVGDTWETLHPTAAPTFLWITAAFGESWPQTNIGLIGSRITPFPLLVVVLKSAYTLVLATEERRHVCGRPWPLSPIAVVNEEATFWPQVRATLRQSPPQRWQSEDNQDSIFSGTVTSLSSLCWCKTIKDSLFWAKYEWHGPGTWTQVILNNCSTVEEITQTFIKKS